MTKDGFGKYHIFKDDHEVRLKIAESCGIDILEDFENCGGHIP